MLVGSPKGYTASPTARIIPYEGGRVIKIPGMTQQTSEKFFHTFQACNRACMIAAKVFSGKGLGIPGFKHQAITEPQALKLLPKLTLPIHLDFETSGLSPITDKPVSLAFAGDGANDMVYVVMGNPVNLMREIVKRKLPIVATNSKFEQGFFIVSGGHVQIAGDPQVDYALMRENSLKGLEYLASEVGLDGYEMPMLEFLEPLQRNKLAMVKDRKLHHQVPAALLAEYNASDVFVQRAIHHVSSVNVLKERGRPEEVKSWLLRGQTLLAYLETRGMKTDAKEVAKQYSKRQADILALETKICKVANSHGMKDFNPGSAPQRVELLYGKMKLPVLCTTSGDWVFPEDYKPGWFYKTNSSPATGADAIDLLSIYDPGNTFISMLGEYNKAKALQDGVVNRLFEVSMRGDGFMRGNFDLTKLLTGQISSTNPPMQNIVKDGIRRCFVSRFKGGVIAEWDYNQLHLRIMGNLAQCEGFINAYSSGDDLHCKTAAEVVMEVKRAVFDSMMKRGDAKADKARQDGKVTNFSIIFEIGARSLAIALKKPIAACKKIIEKWFDTFPEIKDQIDRQHKFAEDHGYVISPFGRVRHLPDADSSINSVKFRQGRQAGDYLISNSGRYVTLYGMIALDEEMRKRKLKSVLIGQVHDSVMGDLHPAEVQDVQELAQKHLVIDMNESQVDWMTPIPFEMDGFFGPNWHKPDRTHKVTMTSEKLTVKKEKA